MNSFSYYSQDTFGFNKILKEKNQQKILNILNIQNQQQYNGFMIPEARKPPPGFNHGPIYTDLNINSKEFVPGKKPYAVFCTQKKKWVKISK